MKTILLFLNLRNDEQVLKNSLLLDSFTRFNKLNGSEMVALKKDGCLSRE
jgi:hypothetical protein